MVSRHLQLTLQELGVQAQPCDVTSDPTEAHILVWIEGSPTPPLPHRAVATFLAPASVAPATGGGSATPRPTATDNAGLTTNDARTAAAVVALAAVAAVALLVGARVLSARRYKR